MIIHPGKWVRSTVLPVPVEVNGLKTSVISLNGKWKLKLNPQGNYWDNSSGLDGWEDIMVPSDISVIRNKEGIKIGEYAYKKIISIPADFKGKKIFLRFEGSNGFTRVWVDGHYVTEHRNGFITWNCDITDYVTPGYDAVLTVGINEDADDVSGFNRGGLIRDVWLMALPEIHITRLHGETTFDDEYKDATLKVMLGTSCRGKEEAEVELKLISPAGEEMEMDIPVVTFDGLCPEKEIEIKVESPLKWDAEHPWLYTLEARLKVKGEVVEKVQRRIGFRQIKITGNQMYINGQEVKLRGVCRHEISPLNGRALTRELTERDVKLFKEANINYIRTSHYPPSEYFLDLCDQYGIYVEDEIALAFISRTLKYTPQSPAHAERYLEFMSEFIERDRSHPSVVIWSLANESFYGPNFALINDYAHAEDPTRPTKFSYPMTMQEEDKPVDIWSIHYSNYYADLAKKHDNVSLGYSPGYDRPVLHDEYAHVACYNRDEHKRDPAVRSFWGESIKRFWDNIWNTKGALGGAIWAGIDEVNIHSGGETVLEWGIIDIWRRPKPEYWMVKKAYSPVRIEKEEYENPGKDVLRVEVENRFNHTNLKEIRIEWRVGEKEGVIEGFDLEPRCKGIFEIPVSEWKEGDIVNLKFIDGTGMPVDEYNLEVGGKARSLPEAKGPAPDIVENGEEIRIVGKEYEVVFSKEDGLVKWGKYKGDVLIKGGPCMNMTGLKLPEWRLERISTEKGQNEAVVKIKGSYGDVLYVTFNVGIDGEGLITTGYTIDKITRPMPRTVKIRVGVDCGGLDELGVYYILDGRLDTLEWERKGLWSAYPEDHISRNRGKCRKNNGGLDPSLGEEPKIPWSQDEKNYALYGRYDIGLRGTNDFRSMKHNIYSAAVYAEGREWAVRAESDGSHSVRLELMPNPSSMIDDRDPGIKYVGTWYAVKDESGSWCDTEMWSNTPGDYAEYTFRGTGICWIGSVDMICGMADVYIDGKLVARDIDLLVDGVEFPGASIGHDKRYGKVLYSVTGLEEGSHTIRIQVTGKKNARSANSYVVIDAFRVIGEHEKDDIKLIINNDYNYPRLSWGNYMRNPIIIGEGYSDKVYIRLAQR